MLKWLTELLLKLFNLSSQDKTPPSVHQENIDAAIGTATSNQGDIVAKKEETHHHHYADNKQASSPVKKS